MGTYVNPGNASFKMASQSKIYVDKTGLLEYTNEVLGTEQRCICVSRARRFGKSMAAGMLAAYYDKSCDSTELFQDLKISKTLDFEKHLNQHNVIQMDITTFHRDGENAMDMVSRINTDVIDELREVYPGVIPEGENYLPQALAILNKVKGSSFVIIVDEWDAIFRDYKSDTNAQKAYVNLLRGLFKAEPSKKFVKLAYLTGILPIKKYGTESALNNFDEFTMINPKKLAEYVGFTQDEVLELCRNYDMDFDEAKRWYDGYTFRKVQHVYNPNSVVKAMLAQDYDNYWSQTETYQSLNHYISMNFDGLKDSVISLLGGGRCRVNIDTYENDMTSFQDRDDVLTVLIHLGYLAYDRNKREVYIPNEEVRSAFSNAIYKSDWKQVIQAIQASDDLLKATWRKDAETVANAVDEVHMSNTSVLNYNDENALSCVITLAYYNAINDYTLVREMPSGRGYADIVFLPRKYSDKPAMVVELKYNKSADGAISQIKERKYTEGLKEYKGNLLLVAINYDKETKKHSCVIEEWEK